MKVFKLTLVFLTIVVMSVASANEPELSFHVGCDSVSSECAAFQFFENDGKTVLAKKAPDIVVGPNEIAEAEVVSGDYGQQHLQLRFEKAVAAQLAQVTASHIGKQLVVVANGKAVIAPRVAAAINGGSLVINAGLDRNNKYLEALPWLKKMSEIKKAGREQRSLLSILLFIGLGLFLIGGSIYFAFFFKRV